MSIREASHIHIDSHDRISGNDGHFKITVSGIQGKNYDYVCLLSAVFPKTYYLVQEGYNTFTLSENGTNTTITVTPGNYNYKSFATYMSALLTSSSSQGYVYVLSTPGSSQAQTGKYTITVTNNGAVQPKLIFSANNNLHEQFGFSRASTNSFVASTITSVNVVNFQIEPALYVHSPDMVDNKGDDVLAVVFSSSPDFSSIVYDCPQIEARSKKLKSISNTYEIAITDEDKIPIDFNGNNCILEILFYKKDNINDLWRTFLEIQTIKSKSTVVSN
jgi:hypothetical protein